MFLLIQISLKKWQNMLSPLSKHGTIIIEVQYLMNTLKDLTFDNIYHDIIITGL